MSTFAVIQGWDLGHGFVVLSASNLSRPLLRDTTGTWHYYDARPEDVGKEYPAIHDDHRLLALMVEAREAMEKALVREARTALLH